MNLRGILAGTVLSIAALSATKAEAQQCRDNQPVSVIVHRHFTNGKVQEPRYPLISDSDNDGKVDRTIPYDPLTPHRYFTLHTNPPVPQQDSAFVHSRDQELRDGRVNYSSLAGRDTTFDGVAQTACGTQPFTVHFVPVRQPTVQRPPAPAQEAGRGIQRCELPTLPLEAERVRSSLPLIIEGKDQNGVVFMTRRNVDDNLSVTFNPVENNTYRLSSPQNIIQGRDNLTNNILADNTITRSELGNGQQLYGRISGRNNCRDFTIAFVPTTPAPLAPQPVTYARIEFSAGAGLNGYRSDRSNDTNRDFTDMNSGYSFQTKLIIPLGDVRFNINGQYNERNGITTSNVNNRSTTDRDEWNLQGTAYVPMGKFKILGQANYSHLSTDQTTTDNGANSNFSVKKVGLNTLRFGIGPAFGNSTTHGYVNYMFQSRDNQPQGMANLRGLEIGLMHTPSLGSSNAVNIDFRFANLLGGRLESGRYYNEIQASAGATIWHGPIGVSLNYDFLKPVTHSSTTTDHMVTAKVQLRVPNYFH